MKQLLIANTEAFGTNANPGKGQISIQNLKTGNFYTATDVIANDFAIYLGRGTNLTPIIIPEVNFKSMKANKAKKTAGSNFTVAVTIPTPVAGLDYTIIVVKKGLKFNERANWTVTQRAITDSTASSIASKLAESINASSENSGVKATVSNAVITITGSEYVDYQVIAADALDSSAVGTPTAAVKPIGDKAYIQDLALQCAAGKGFKYLAEDGSEIYPGFPEEVLDSTYQVFTIRFAVPRASAKQRDEVVYQTVHIAAVDGKATCTALKTLLGVN